MKVYRTIIILLLFLYSFRGCLDDGNITYPTLSGTSWVKYHESAGVLYMHRLTFGKGGGGEEIIEDVDYTDTYYFNWYWDEYALSTLWLEYGPDDYIRFDVDILEYDLLTGYFNGSYVEFVPY